MEWPEALCEVLSFPPLYDGVHLFTNCRYWAPDVDFEFCMRTYVLGILGADETCNASLYPVGKTWFISWGSILTGTFKCFHFLTITMRTVLT